MTRAALSLLVRVAEFRLAEHRTGRAAGRGFGAVACEGQVRSEVSNDY
jgi:hypothetical protein